MPGDEDKRIQDLTACMSYEHRKKDGALVSKGEMKIDRHKNVHYIRKDAKGKLLSEIVLNREGKIIKEVKKK